MYKNFYYVLFFMESMKSVDVATSMLLDLLKLFGSDYYDNKD